MAGYVKPRIGHPAQKTGIQNPAKTAETEFRLATACVAGHVVPGDGERNSVPSRVIFLDKEAKLHRGWNKLSQSFRSRFEVVVAQSEPLRDAVYRVRHVVYCEEFAFERPSSKQREVDRYDAHSTALLVRDLLASDFIACARIIHANPDEPDDPLPFEIATKGKLDRALLETQPIPRALVGEISRLAVVSQFRRRRTDANTPAPLSEHDFSEGESSRFPFILAGLYLGIVALAQIEGLERLYLLTEARLAAHIRRIGVDITPIGEPVEHRGSRIPSMLEVSKVTAGISGYIRPLYEAIHDGIARQMRSEGSCVSVPAAIE